MNYKIVAFTLVNDGHDEYEFHAKSKKELIAVLKGIEDFNTNVDIIDVDTNKRVFSDHSYKAVDFAKELKVKKEFTLREIKDMCEDGTLEALGFSKETIDSFRDSTELAIKVNNGDCDVIWEYSEIIKA